ncbi:MAG: hypothetical protein ABI678_19455, partial [Kofleriaceae bacterium]
MTSGDALGEFERLLAARGLAVATLSLRDGIAAMLDFYRTVRADDCVIADDGDMLLFQWNPNELDLTRQFIRTGGEDDDIWQLSLTFVLPPSALASGHRWCATPAELPELSAFIDAHPLARATP